MITLIKQRPRLFDCLLKLSSLANWLDFLCLFKLPSTSMQVLFFRDKRTLFSEEAYELITLITLAVTRRIPYTDLSKQIFTHPTLAEDLKIYLRFKNQKNENEC